MPKANKMTCPDCGVDMNHHADKIDYSAALARRAAGDTELGGVVEEVHACPGCGRTEVRVAS